MFFLILFLIYLYFGIILPMKLLSKRFIYQNKYINKSKIYLLSKLFKLFIYSIFFFLIMAIVLHYYNTGTPLSTSDLCIGNGGWTYSCWGDEKIAFNSLILMFFIIIIYYKLCEIEIFDLFKNYTGKSKYFLSIIYFAFLILYNFWLILVLSGFFISTHYKSMALELFRLIVMFLPISLFPLSIYMNLLIKKISSFIKKRKKLQT